MTTGTREHPDIPTDVRICVVGFRCVYVYGVGCVGAAQTDSLRNARTVTVRLVCTEAVR